MKFAKYAFLSIILLLGGFYALNVTAATEHENTVQKAYIAYYGRPADPAGLDYWAGRLEAANGDLTGLINEFGNSDEYKERFGNLDNETLIKNIYQNLFNRDPDSAGLDYYKTQLETGQATLADISLKILNGATGNDLPLINNKMEVANYYTVFVSNECNTYDITKSTSILKGITANTDTIVIAKKIIEACLINESTLDLFNMGLTAKEELIKSGVALSHDVPFSIKKENAIYIVTFREFFNPDKVEVIVRLEKPNKILSINYETSNYIYTQD